MRFKLDENLPAALFGRDKPVVSRHLHRVFNDREPERVSVVAISATTGTSPRRRN
jgi:hypothetical protein